MAAAKSAVGRAVRGGVNVVRRILGGARSLVGSGATKNRSDSGALRSKQGRVRRGAEAAIKAGGQKRKNTRNVRLGIGLGKLSAAFGKGGKGGGGSAG